MKEYICISIDYSPSQYCASYFHLRAALIILFFIVILWYIASVEFAIPGVSVSVNDN